MRLAVLETAAVAPADLRPAALSPCLRASALALPRLPAQAMWALHSRGKEPETERQATLPARLAGRSAWPWANQACVSAGGCVQWGWQTG